MSHAHLHLVRPTTEHPNDNLYFERRSTDRRCVSGRVTALISNRPAAEGSMSGGAGYGDTFFGEPTSRICSLRLLDVSDLGLGALSQDPIAVGAQITVFIPPHGAERGYDLRGTVVRCTPRPRDHGHHVGIRFSSRLAA